MRTCLIKYNNKLTTILYKYDEVNHIMWFNNKNIDISMITDEDVEEEDKEEFLNRDVAGEHDTIFDDEMEKYDSFLSFVVNGVINILIYGDDIVEEINELVFDLDFRTLHYRNGFIYSLPECCCKDCIHLELMDIISK